MGTTANENMLLPNFAVWLEIRKLETFIIAEFKFLGNARRITTENALTDLYIYLFGTKFLEMTDTAAVWQTIVTLCCAVLFEAINNPPKCDENRIL